MQDGCTTIGTCNRWCASTEMAVNTDFAKFLAARGSKFNETQQFFGAHRNSKAAQIAANCGSIKDLFPCTAKHTAYKLSIRPGMQAAIDPRLLTYASKIRCNRAPAMPNECMPALMRLYFDEMYVGCTCAPDVPDDRADEVQSHGHAPHLVPGAVLQDVTRRGSAKHPRQHACGSAATLKC